MSSLTNNVELQINPLDPAELIYCTNLLNDYRDAWPLISQLQQEPKHLIDSMKQASTSALEALARLSRGTDWAVFTEVFLVKTYHELSLINREVLFNFLRHTQWLEQLNSFSAQASRLMSLGFLTQLCNRIDEDPHASLRPLQKFADEYPFAVHRQVLRQLVDLQIGQGSLNKDFMVLLDGLVQKMTGEEQCLFLKELPLSHVLALMEHGIALYGELDALCQSACSRVLFFLSAQAAKLNTDAREQVRASILRQGLNTEGQEGAPQFLIEAFFALQFMANLTPIALRKLILSYRCFILTLNNKELRSYIASEQEHKSFDESVSSPLTTAHSSDQNQNVLHWCIQRSVHSFLFSATNECAPAVFYDSDGACIGHLGETGYFSHAPSAHQELSARLLSLVPTQELEQSGAGLSFLLTNILLEQSIALCYQAFDLSSDEGRQKCHWFEQQLAHTIIEAQYPIPSSTWDTLVEYMHSDNLFLLCSTIKNFAQARFLFNSLLQKDATRHLLLSPRHELLVRDFLNKQGAAFSLADYLLYFHQQAWFAEGLRCFAAFAHNAKMPFLLRDALEVLFLRAQNRVLSAQLHHQILLSLITSEQVASIVLHDFCGDDASQPVQKIRKAELDEVLGYFNKPQFLALLRQLNSNVSWQGSNQFRLALFVLQSHQERLLIASEAKSSQWTRKDLNALAVFINRHLEEKNSWDSHLFIGHKVLGMLLFLSAESGQTTLFFKEKNRLSRAATYATSPILLAHLVDKLILPSSAKQGDTQELEIVPKDWRLYREQWASQFKENSLVQDWHTLIMATYNKTDKRIPILCPYLLRYNGSKKPVLHLLERYFSVCAQHQSLIHPVSELMRQFPDHSISAVIFDAMQRSVIQNPQLLDLTILAHMTQYYAKKRGDIVPDKMGAHLLLLSSWGQEKQYALMHQCCTLLLSVNQKEQVKQQLIRAAVEARVEPEVQKLLNRAWYGMALVSLKRLWVYGFNWKKNTSQLLVFCDEKPRPFVRPEFAPLNVSHPVQSEDSFAQQHQQFIHLLAQIQRSALSAPVCDEGVQARHPHALFYDKSWPQAEELLEEVASQQGMVNV